LRRRDRVEDLFLRHPSVFINHHPANVRDHRQPSAEAGQPKLEEDFGERAPIDPFFALGLQTGTPLAPEAAPLIGESMIETGQRRKRRRFNAVSFACLLQLLPLSHLLSPPPVTAVSS